MNWPGNYYPYFGELGRWGSRKAKDQMDAIEQKLRTVGWRKWQLWDSEICYPISPHLLFYLSLVPHQKPSPATMTNSLDQETWKNNGFCNSQVVPKPTVQHHLGTLIKMEILRPHLRPTKSDTLTVCVLTIPKSDSEAKAWELLLEFKQNLISYKVWHGKSTKKTLG